MPGSLGEGTAIPAPQWLVTQVREAKRGHLQSAVAHTSDLIGKMGLHTVCESARCPNRGECFSRHTATVMIMGDICTRGCRFCAVNHGRPKLLDSGEPERLAEAVARLGLRHAVITSVTRDDLADGGAHHFAEVVAALRRRCPGVVVELLVPDFRGEQTSIRAVCDAGPDVLAHNIETVPRLYRSIRAAAHYELSLQLLRQAKSFAPKILTKSGIMLGLGEEPDEVSSVLKDLREAGCDMLTIGQYLAPSLYHAPVARYVAQSEFEHWKESALALGFRSVASGPLVRSSYKAGAFFQETR